MNGEFLVVKTYANGVYENGGVIMLSRCGYFENGRYVGLCELCVLPKRARWKN